MLNKNKAALENIQTRFRDQVPGFISYIDKDAIIYALCPENSTSRLCTELNKQAKVLHPDQYYLLLSDKFDDFQNVEMHKYQADALIHYVRHRDTEEHVFRFFDYYLNIIAFNYIEILGEKASLPNVIRFLRYYDKHNNKQYLETLEYYLDNHMNASKTATELGIHLNTLRKRLEKINELTMLELDNPTVVSRLRFAIKQIKLR